LEVARERLRGRRQSVADEVRHAYYGLLRSQSGLAASEQALLALHELDRVVQTRVEEKVELPVAGLEVKARLSQEEYEALSLRNALQSGRERLNDLLGRAIDVPFGVEEAPDLPPGDADLEGLRARALTYRADLKEARLRQQQADLDHRLKKWDFVPDVSLTSSYLSLPDVDLLPP